MAFFIHSGRITVNVGTPTTTFSIGRGGQWQVPRGIWNRPPTPFSLSTLLSILLFWGVCEGGADDSAGNFYSMINESETKDAVVFFAQGCQWNGEMEGVPVAGEDPPVASAAGM